MEEKFIKLYSDIELIGENKEIKTLHSNCPNCNICWSDIESKKPGDDGFWTISKPWIGKNYSKLRLLAIGINMNEYGSYDGLNKLINWSKEQILEGKRKMFVTANYSGTFLFHRLGCYSTAFAEAASLLQSDWKNSCPLPRDIDLAFDLIAYTNQIKCSPVGDKSKPSYQMWENCGKFIFRKEIKVLNPNKILILGTSDNLHYFNKYVLDSEININWNGNVGTGIGFVNKKEIKIYVLPHTSSFGGNSLSLIDELRAELNNS